VVAENKVDRFPDLFGQLGVLGQSVRARGEVACDDHDFAGRLIDGLIELVPRPISRDSLSNPMGQHRDQTEKSFPLESINS